ncbi:MAG: hypothetical protein DRP16_04750, partial [Candidatus Aenigmatarchaeota archaeon]
SILVLADAYGVSSSLRTHFLVKKNYEFDIIRDTPVVIDPQKGWFDSVINLVSFVNASNFTFREYLPKEFQIANTTAKIIRTPNETVLEWENLGNSSRVYYSFKAPKLWPYLYEFGPAEIEYDSKTFLEARPWYLATDPSFGYIEHLIDSGVNVDEISDIQILDFDKDGDLDVIACAYGSDEVNWWRNEGDNQNFTNILIQDTANTDGLRACKVLDFDGDGDYDVVYAAGLENRIAWLENSGDNQTFTDHAINESAADCDNPSDIEVLDFDKDGDYDVVAALEDDDEISWFRNEGDNLTFTKVVILKYNLNLDGVQDIQVLDFDGDGDYDIVYAAYLEDRLAWLNNSGDNQTFTDMQVCESSITCNGVRSVDVVDFNGDGYYDLVSAAYDGNEVFWFNNSGDNQTFTKILVGSGYVCNGSKHAIHVDFDQDGDYDIVLASYLGDRLAWWNNTGDNQTFTEMLIVNGSNANGAWKTQIADFDYDGDPDILLASYDGDRLAWWENVIYREWWNKSWLYRKNITIVNNLNFSLTNYPVSLIWNTQYYVQRGKLQPDCDDIRIIENGYIQKPWWNQTDCNTPNTKIWFSVDLPANGNKTLQLYYGNPDAENPGYSGGQIFTVFDDFNDGVINTSIWNNVGCVESNGEMLCDNAGDRVYTSSTYLHNYSVTWRTRFVDGDRMWVGFISGGSAPFAIVERYAASNWGARNYVTAEEYTAFNTSLLGVYATYEITWNDTENDYYVNDELKAQHTEQVPQSGIPVTMYNSYADTNQFTSDYMFLRRYYYPEPTVTLETEEEYSNWWNTSWMFRIPLKVTPEETVNDYPVEVEINFTEELQNFNWSGKTLDINSFRLVEYNLTTDDVLGLIPVVFTPPFDFNATSNAYGNVTWILNGTNPKDKTRYFHLYFDVLEAPSGAKENPNYSIEKQNLFWGTKFLAPTAGDATLFIIASEETNVSINGTINVTVGSGSSPGVYRTSSTSGLGGSGTSPNFYNVTSDKPVLVFTSYPGDDSAEYIPPYNPNATEFYMLCGEEIDILNLGNSTASVTVDDIPWSGNSGDNDFSLLIPPGEVGYHTCTSLDFFHITSDQPLVVYTTWIEGDDAGETKAIMFDLDSTFGYYGRKTGKVFKGPINPRDDDTDDDGGVAVVSLYDGNQINVSCSDNGGSLVSYANPYSADKGEVIAIENDTDYCEITSTKDVYVLAYDEDTDPDQDLYTDWAYVPAADADGFIGKEFVIFDTFNAPQVGEESHISTTDHQTYIGIIALEASTFYNITRCNNGTTITSGTLQNRGDYYKQ